MPLKPVSGKIQSQEINDNFSYLESTFKNIDKGSPKGVFEKLSDLVTAYPNGNDGLYIVTDNGHWYFWNGSVWESGGVYQSEGIAVGGIKEDNIANGAVTSAKRTTLGGQAYIITPNTLPNIDLSVDNRSLVFDVGTIFHYTRARVTLSEVTRITLEYPYNIHYILLDFITREFTVVNSSTAISSLSQNLAYVATIIFETQQTLKSVDIACDYTVNNELKSRTRQQGMATLNFGPPFKLPNINMSEKTVEIFGQTSIYWDNKRHVLNDTTDSVLKIDFKNVWEQGDISPRIYFDIFEKRFVVLRSNDLGSILEHHVLFAELRKGKGQTLLDVNMSCSYTIDGESPIALITSERPFAKILNIPSGWYESPEVGGYETASQYDNNIHFSDVYNVYDRLVSENSNYVKRKNPGMDATGTFPWYYYEFKPESAELSLYGKTIPKFIMFTGVHGEEKASVLALRNFMQQICDNWQNDPILKFLRHNVHFIIVPIANPYGFNARTRKNGRGVDINRNWDYNWAGDIPGSDPDNSTYKGPEPFSEAETRQLRDVVLIHPDAMCVVDFHHNGGGGTEYNNSYWHLVTQLKPGFEEFNLISRQNVTDITVAAKLNYNVPTDSGLLGYVSYQGLYAGTVHNYVCSIGIPSMVVECCKKMPYEENVYTANVMQLNTEFIANFILNTLRQFNK